MPDLAATIAELTSAASRCAEAARSGAQELSDELLLDVQRHLAESGRLVELASASLAAEVAQRSRPELGYAGLAQKLGARTPEALVQSITGASSSTARRLVRVGVMVAEAAAHDADPALPLTEAWLAPVLRAATSGAISAEAVEVIRTGLGAPNESIAPETLRDAALRLVAEAGALTLERLAARAREARDELDTAGVASREEERRGRRSLRLYPQLDGMTRLVALLDPESAAILTGAIDAATSPRRGGPRFVDPDDVARAEGILADPRTTEQLAVDALVDLVDVALRSSSNTLLGARRAAVRVLVTQADLDRREGVGFVAGQTASVSVSTVERHACEGGLVPILFNDRGESLNLGRSSRLHNARQRTVIAARDGGCLAPQCDRPASWSEVHHINEFGRGGKTELNDGVLLCRHHHMMVHNNGWRVRRKESKYWFIPPPSIDPRQTPIPLHTKSPAVRRLLVSA